MSESVNRELEIIIDAKIAPLYEVIAEVRDGQKELERAIRGHNNTPGLITEIALLKRDQANATDKVISWAWLRDKAAVPVFTGFIMWFLFGVLPGLLSK